MSRKIKLGFSTCPNDTFMFDALVNGKILNSEYSFSVKMDDIFHLNQRAIAGEDDLIKVSYNTFGRLMDQYQLLRAGSAMGKGCGPLLVARPGTSLDSLDANSSIAIPGLSTTANLLLTFFNPGLKHKREMLFHEVMPAVSRGETVAGVIIHENRFTYPDHGLICLADLGEYWEKETGLPIPLGAIVAKKSLGREILYRLNELVKASVEYAFHHPDSSAGYIRMHAQEMDEAVCKAHIDLYVNEYSLDFGPEGEAAIRKLLEAGEQAGLMSGGSAMKFQSQLDFWKAG